LTTKKKIAGFFTVHRKMIMLKIKKSELLESLEQGLTIADDDGIINNKREIPL
jgi:hypothetical protein